MTAPSPSLAALASDYVLVPREADQATFEEWMASSDYPEIADVALAKLPNGDYRSQLTFAAWQGWQGASRHRPSHCDDLLKAMEALIESGDELYSAGAELRDTIGAGSRVDACLDDYAKASNEYRRLSSLTQP